MSESKRRSIVERGDGFGAQFLTIIYSAAYCNHHSLEFVYKPIRIMEHNYDNDPEFINKIEELINFRNNFTNYNNLTQNEKEGVVDFQIWDIINLIKKDCNLYLGRDNIQTIRKYFLENKNLNYFDNNYFNVAVHVRRPNSHDNRIEGGNIPDTYYLNTINKIRQKHSDKKLLFHIYSQGDVNNFASYLNDDIVLHINESLSDTFISLVTADALVMSASDLSYSAAVLSLGEIYYLYQGWYAHPPLSHWIVNNP